jgi:two-component system KDP operon response regulator KdpE
MKKTSRLRTYPRVVGRRGEGELNQPDLAGALPETRVLVLMDRPLVAAVIGLTLKHGVFVTRDAADSSGALRLLAEWQPHLAVIDIELGEPQLFERIAGSGGVGSRIPVVGLTRRGDLKSKLEAFERGVDDILTMPFSPEELLARVLAAARRAYGARVRLRPVLQVGEIGVDILNRRALIDSHELPLSALDQCLLYLLAANAGQVITRDEILDTLWGADFVAESSFVDQHVRNLRTKLENDGRKPRFIATVPGQGYRFMQNGAVVVSAH